MRIYSTILLLVAASLYAMGARQSSAQESGLPFLQVGVDAQGMATGEAATASASGAFASFWNAAGLASQTGNEIGLAHHRWVGTTRTYAVGARFSSGESSGVGLFLLANDSGSLEERTIQGPPTGTFSAQYLSVGVSYARSFGPIQIGASTKYLSERIADASANGYAVDVGIQGAVKGTAAGFGIAANNLGSISELEATSTTLPAIVRAGIFVFPFRVVSWLDNAALLTAQIEAEASYLLNDERVRFHFGTSAELFEMLSARVGYVTNDALRGFTIGLGLRAAVLNVDYAIVPFEGGFGGPGHVISLRYGW